mgnify:CR=1 FL=1
MKEREDAQHADQSLYFIRGSQLGTEIDCLIYFTFLSPAFLSVSLQILFSLELFSRLIERSFDFCGQIPPSAL